MFTEFLSQNILWVGAFIVVANLLLLSSLQGKIKGVSAVSALHLPRLQRSGKSVIIDVNEPTAFAASHIPDSVNFPMATVNASNKDLLKHKDKTTIVVCQMGSRSNKAAKSLVSMGFTDLHVLRGGLNAWIKEKLPTVSS